MCSLSNILYVTIVLHLLLLCANNSTWRFNQPGNQRVIFDNPIYCPGSEYDSYTHTCSQQASNIRFSKNSKKNPSQNSVNVNNWHLFLNSLIDHSFIHAPIPTDSHSALYYSLLLSTSTSIGIKIHHGQEWRTANQKEGVQDYWRWEQAQTRTKFWHLPWK